MQRGLGCLSPLGVAAAVVVLAGLVLFTWIKGPVLFSPGPLNAVAGRQALGGVATHAALGSHCGACHTAPWSTLTMADRCNACHTDIADQITTRTGLHGGLVTANAGHICRGCHSDHKGA